MQPYFLPYIGYWRLLNSVDTFVMFDEVQYIRHGWINRNRVLKHGGGWQYIVVPLRKHGREELIQNLCAHETIDWRGRIIGQLQHYKFEKRAPYYEDAVGLLIDCFSGIDNFSITNINKTIFEKFCRYFGITTEILVSSDLNLDYRNVNHPGDWALTIADQLGADEYINPVSGAFLFDPVKFHSSDIGLSFLQSPELVYQQGSDFEPSMSIIDVLMFNGLSETRKFLDEFSIEKST